MHGEPQREGHTYPAEFVSKLYRMLDNPEYNGIVCWSNSKDSFMILNISAFQEKIIPREFSHANFSSFVRQLNKYDFHKQRFNETNSRIWEFKHKDFKLANKDRPHIIKRKPPSSRNQAFQESVEELQSLLADVQGRVEKLEAENKNIYQVVEKQERVISLLMDAGPPHGQHPPGGGSGPPAGTPQIAHHQHIDPHRQGDSAAVAASHPPPPHIPPNAGHHPPGQPHVAVAMTDDNARNITANLLREYGCIVDTTDSGVDLIRLVEIKSYRVVFLEPVLTAIDGISTAAMIRRFSLELPLVFCVDKEQAGAGFTEAYYQSRGISTVIWRPFTKQDLYSALVAYL